MATVSALPKLMKSAVVDKAGPANTLHIKELRLPSLAHNHVIIALHYAGVGIWDAQQRAGTFGKVKPGTILGANGSGTIAAVDSAVQGLSVGDRVYSYSYGNDKGGFHAEYVSVPADRVERVPAHLDMRVAGGMPCVALTAQSGLEVLKVKRGQTILVFGASGGVGSLAVWLANVKGVTVIGTARPDAQEYVRELGAAHTIGCSDPKVSKAKPLDLLVLLYCYSNVSHGRIAYSNRSMSTRLPRNLTPSIFNRALCSFAASWRSLISPPAPNTRCQGR